MASSYATRAVHFEVGTFKLTSNPRATEHAPRDRGEAIALVRESIRPAERPELAEQMTDAELAEAIKVICDVTRSYELIWGSFEAHS